MRLMTITILLTLTLLCGCSPSPAPVYGYEGAWVDDVIPLTLEVGLMAEGPFTYVLSSYGNQYLNGVFMGQPDGSLSFQYYDGGQRRITLIGVISGDTLTGTFEHTGLSPSIYLVEMTRGER